MILPSYLFKKLIDNNADFFTGVPDSLLKDFCAYVTDHTDNSSHIIAANEGAAVSLAAGYYMATSHIPVVYLQNSGLGNIINPLLSLLDPEVYNIPSVFFIGWRGEPGVKDEPQHVKQGKVTLDMLTAMGIEHSILGDNEDALDEQLSKCFNSIREKGSPYVFVVRKDTFEKYKLVNKIETNFELTRENAIQFVVNALDNQDIVVSTTGMASRELYEHRDMLAQGHEKDFLTVGSMGHASQIALSIALNKKDKNVYCIDGDGAVLMHMGSLAIIGNLQPANFKHIVINNGAHDSVGGQPTTGFFTNFPGIAKACGYKEAISVETKNELQKAIEMLKKIEGPFMLEVRVNKGARENLGRPKTSPKQNLAAFTKFINS
jgi:phosphonopyruvate decarboxylase